MSVGVYGCLLQLKRFTTKCEKIGGSQSAVDVRSGNSRGWESD
jgi:hypothetical protein